MLRFCWLEAVAISPDGTRLALLGHELLLADTAGTVLETLVTANEVGSDPIDVEFSHDGSHVYYSTSNGEHGASYYRVALDGTGLELVHNSDGSAESSTGRTGFALTRKDSILDYFDSERGWPKLSPVSDDVMAYVESDWYSGKLRLVNLSTDSVMDLACSPASQSSAAYPSWFPDGRKLVFCATVSGTIRRLELWMLDSVEY